MTALRLWTALLLMLVVAACDDPKPQANAPPPPAVTVAVPLKQDITEWDEYTGRFEAVQYVDVRARVSGFIESVHFADGQMVREGDRLFVIDQRPFKLAVQQAEAEVSRAQATLDLANIEFERASPLVESNAISRSQLDIRRTTVQQALAEVAAAKAALESSKLNLEWSSVKAPISGRISDAKVDVGNLITGGQLNSTLLTTIVSLDPIHFVFDASEADLLKYTRLSNTASRPSSRDVANPVRAKLADETDFVHEGRMDFVDNQIDTGSGTIRGRAVFKNTDQLLQPGMFARLQLLGRSAPALMIPDSAIASDQSRRIVFTIEDDGTVTPKVISLGPIVKGLRVVRSGLEATDRIVINGIQRARPGQKVTPEEGKIVAQSGN